MSAGADYTIGAVVSRDDAIAAFATVYGIPKDEIVFFPEPFTDWPAAEVVLVQHDLPGDYPTQYVTWDANEQPQSSVAAALAVELGAPVIIGADSFDPTDMEFHLPDGTTHRIVVDQDEDAGFRNTPTMTRLIANARRNHARTASPAKP